MSHLRAAAVVELTAPRSPHVRSAISNGSRLPGGASASSADGRRFADIIFDLTAEMGGALTTGEELQVRTIAGLIVHVEQLQAAMLRGDPVDSEQLTRVSNSATRALAGLKRSRPAKRAQQPATDAYLASRVPRA
jgi:hypothetical protein